MTRKHFSTLCFVLSFLLLGIIPASGTERLCDVSFEDCRAPLLNLIRNENVEIDVAFWFMDDASISNALIKKFQSGVPVRILVDPRADDGHSTNTQILMQLASAGFPMRNRTPNVNGTATGILHWKMMLFSGQGTVEFSGANFTPSEMMPVIAYENYVDEAIYYSDDPTVVNSFRMKYDDWWTDLTDYQDYAHASAPQRAYPNYAINPELDFLPSSIPGMDYGNRTMSAIAKEKSKLDIDMFRITNAQITDATITAFKRGLPIRMIVDSSEYRNRARVWDSYNVDRLFMAGIPLKITEHLGQNHEKALILYGQGMSIWGSSNWTWPSFNYQQEHDYFTLKPLFFEWFQNQFERRWNSDTEYKAFVPMGVGVGPTIKSPSTGATNQPISVTLTWEGGPWAQQYDVYFGTTSNPPLLAQNVVTGAPEDPSGPLTYETYKVSGLAPATQYYWKIVSKTMANLSATGPPWTFTTGTPATGKGATVTAISPTTGPSSGTTKVTITGTNFLTGAIVSFGQSTASSTKVVSSTTITAVAPPHVGGTPAVPVMVGITVTNKAGDTGTLPAAYGYTSTNPPTAPQLNVIHPNSGSPSGGDSVTISGHNLVPGMTVTIGGAPATISSSNSVSIQATTPSGTGVADVVVTNPDRQSATLKGAFTYSDPPGPPSVASTSPNSGSVNGGNTITVNGSGFTRGAVVSVGGATCTTIMVSNSTTITATTPAHPLGSADVVVTNIVDGKPDQSSTLSGGFTYVTAPPPSINSVVPNSGSVAGGSGITINGSNFIFGATLLVGSAAATVQTTTGSYIYATVPAASQPGTVNVVVTNPDGQSSSPGTYTYQ